MNLDDLKTKGFVQQPDGSWSKPKGKTLCEVFVEETKSKRIRQNHKPELNKLEREFQAHLEYDCPGGFIYPQSIRFKLANGIWYKPDFVLFLPLSLQLWAYEVKGPHAFRGGFENLKVAASRYPQIVWYLVWKQDGGWKKQLVMP